MRISRKTIMIYTLIFLIAFAVPITNAEIYVSVSGRVLSENAGEGVSNVNVEARSVDRKIRFNAITDKNGFYILENVIPGEYLLSYYSKNDDYLEEYDAKSITVTSKNLVNVNYVLKLGHSMFGTVYDSDKVTPLSRISVNVKSVDPQPHEWMQIGATMTGNKGDFIIQGLAFSKQYIVSAKISGYSILSKIINLEEAGLPIIFILDKSNNTGISGVVMSDNMPVKDARIVIENNTGEDIGYAFSDETGKYSIKGVPPGLYTVNMYKPEGGFIVKDNISIEQGKSTLVNFEINNQLSR